MQLSCRFYENKFPQIEDIVMVTVKEIAEMGAYVCLLEYNNLEGMVQFSELSRRRIRSINKLLRVGKTEPMVVIRVNADMGYIDVSKRRVTTEGVERCTERYARAKAVHSILRHTASLLDYSSDQQFEQLYARTAWHLDRVHRRVGASYDVFRQACVTPSVLDVCGLEASVLDILHVQIAHKLSVQAVKIRADVLVSCFKYEGINAVKRALKAGIASADACEARTLHVSLISPPMYVLSTNASDRAAGLAMLQTACEAIRESIEAQGGKFELSMGPKVVTHTDEIDLQKRLDTAEAETRQVAGDDDESTEDEDDEGEASA